MAPILEITEASWDKQFAVNTKGLLFMLQAVGASDGPAKAAVARSSTSIQAGRRGEDLVAVYCASKAAVISLTQSAGLDLIKHKINVNGIAPGVIDTPMWDHVDAQFAKYQNLQPGREEAAGGLGRAVRSDGNARGHGGRSRFPGIGGCRLHRGADAECRWWQLDELRAFNSAIQSTPISSSAKVRKHLSHIYLIL